MKNIFLTLSFFIFFNCNFKNNTISELDKNKAQEYYAKANQEKLNGNLDKSENYLLKAHAIDKRNLSYIMAIVGIYKQKNEIDKAFSFIEKFPNSEKESIIYYQIKANLYDHKGDFEQGRENYRKALNLFDYKKPKVEFDLNNEISYSTIETLSGDKEKAVTRINKILKLNWLTESNKDYLETFRNEFEYYQNNGIENLDFKDDIKICTSNIDSISKILKQNHINISSSRTSDNLKGEIFISEKYRVGLQKLKIVTCK